MIQIMQVLTIVIALSGSQDLHDKILEVRVNAPYHCIESRVDLHVREFTTRKTWSMKDLPAGQPARFLLPTGKYMLRVSGDGIATDIAGPVNLDDIDTKEQLTVYLEKWVRLTGLVRNEKGKPVEGARVTLEGLHSLPGHTFNPFLSDEVRFNLLKSFCEVLTATTTDEEGRFQIDGISLNKVEYYRIHIEKSGFRRRFESLKSRFSYKPGSAIQKEWTLVRGESSIILKLENEAGNPVKDGWISWLDPRRSWTAAGFDDYHGMPRTIGPSSPDGKIEIIDPPPGTQDYWIVAKGYKWMEIKSSPGDVRKLELLKISEKLKVSVIDAENGQVIPNARVQIGTLTMFHTPFEITMKELGTFLIEGELSSFPLFITAESPSCPPNHAAIMLGPSKLTGFEGFPFHNDSRPEQFAPPHRDLELEKEAKSGLLKLALRKGWSFSVHVQGKKGIPLDGFNVIAYLSGEQYGFQEIGGEKLIVTQLAPAEAKIDIQGIEPGSLEVRCHAPHYHFGSKEFKIEKDGQKGAIKLVPAAGE